MNMYTFRLFFCPTRYYIDAEVYISIHPRTHLVRGRYICVISELSSPCEIDVC